MHVLQHVHKSLLYHGGRNQIVPTYSCQKRKFREATETDVKRISKRQRECQDKNMQFQRTKEVGRVSVLQPLPTFQERQTMPFPQNSLLWLFFSKSSAFTWSAAQEMRVRQVKGLWISTELVDVMERFRWAKMLHVNLWTFCTTAEPCRVLASLYTKMHLPTCQQTTFLETTLHLHLTGRCLWQWSSLPISCHKRTIRNLGI